MHGPWLNTLQNDGVHGSPDSTLHGACANGVASIWCRRSRASAELASAALVATMRHRTTRRSMKPSMAVAGTTSLFLLHILDAGEDDALGTFLGVAQIELVLRQKH